MNKKISENILLKKFLLIAVVGIVFGIITAHIMSRQADSLNFFTQYNIDIISKSKINYDKLLFTIIVKRISVFILIAVFGLTTGGKSIITTFLFWNTSCMGIVIANVIKCHFVKGIIYFLAFFLPQYLFYVPAMFFAYYQINEFSRKKIDVKRITNKVYMNCIIKYFVSFSLVLLLVLIGILAETYINPIFVKKIVKFM